MAVRVTGQDEIIRNIKRYIQQYPEEVGAAIYEEGLALMAVSQPKVPVDTGRLRGSAYVTPPIEQQNNSPLVEVGYGTDYAIWVHERTELNHTTGEAKFLEKAVNERSGGYTQRIANRTQRNIETGRGMSSVTATYPERPSE